MSQTVDNRIVKMQFDNGQFERGAEHTLGTLDRLKNALHLQDASRGLEAVQRAGENMNFSPAEDSVQRLSLSFSALEIAGITALQNITNFALGKFKNVFDNTIGQIMTGGKKRALNLEQARFSMQGLLKDSEKVEQVINGPVQKAVDQTAYGLDEAAKAASNFIASGVELDNLYYPLRSIAGVAAQTGSSYGEISDIFARIAGNGRVYAIDLQSFASRGLNAAAQLAKYYGVSEEKARDMVSKGKVSFQDFSNAMIEFADNAGKANETYSGALANMKAALSRVGAKFYTPYLKNMRDIFNALRLAINTVNLALDPFFEKLNAGQEVVKKFVVALVDSFNYALNKSKATADGATHQVQWVVKLFRELITSVASIWVVLKNFFSFINDFLSVIGSYATEFFQRLYSSVDRILSPFRQLAMLLNAINSEGEDGFFKALGMGQETNSLKQYLMVFNNFKNLFTKFSEVVANAFGIFTDLWASVAEVFTSKLLPQIVKLAAIIVQPLSIFFDFLSDLGEIIREYGLVSLILNRIADILVGVLKPVISWLESKLTKLENSNYVKFLEYLRDGFRSFAAGLEEALSSGKDFSFIGNGLVSILNDVKNALDPVIEKFKNLYLSIKENRPLEYLKETLGKIKDFLQPLTNGLKDFAQNFKESISFDNLGNFAGLAVLVANGGILYKLYNMFIKINDLLTGNNWKDVAWIEGLKGVAGNIVGIMENIRGAITSFSKSMKSKTIRNIATSLLILAAALLILSLIDAGKLIKATTAMSFMLTELFAFSRAFSKIKLNVGSAASLIALATAVLILSFALKSISAIEPDRLGASLVALTAIIGALGLFTASLQMITSKFPSGQLKKAVAGLIGVAIAIGILARIIKILGGMDPAELNQGLSTTLILITLLGVFSAAMVGITSVFKSGKLSKAVAGIVAVALAIAIIAVSIQKIGALDPKQAEQGLSAVVTLITMLGIFMGSMIALSGAFGKAKSVVPTLITLAIVIDVLSKVVKVLGEMDAAEINQGILAVTALTTVLGAFMAAMMALSNSWGSPVGIAASLIAMGIAISIFTNSISTLAKIPAAQIAKAIIALTAALVIFGGLAFVLGSAWSVILPGVGIMMALAVAMGIFGAGVLALAVGISILSPILLLFATNLVLTARTILQGIGELGSDLITAIVTIITSIFAAIRATIPDLLITLTALLDAFLTFITDNALRIITAGIDLVLAFLNGIALRMPDIVNAGFNIIIAFLEGLGIAFDERGDELGAAAAKLITGLISGIWNAAVTLWTELSEFARQVIEDHFGVDLTDQSLLDVGRNLIAGLWNGIKERTRQLFNDIWEWGRGLVKKMGESVGVKSPSWMFAEIGQYCMEGLAIGLAQTQDPLDAVDEAGNNVLNAFRSTVSNIENAINSDMDMQPTITPVLDLSQIQNGVSSMNGMLNRGSGIAATISGRLNAAHVSADSEMKVLANSIEDAVSKASPMVTLNVYGAQGQDVNQLADIVSARLQHQLNRRGKVYG